MLNSYFRIALGIPSVNIGRDVAFICDGVAIWFFPGTSGNLENNVWFSGNLFITTDGFVLDVVSVWFCFISLMHHLLIIV